MAHRSLARGLARLTVVDPDGLAELEDERRFLLRSLRDLDAELAAGDVDAVDYATLRDGYTKRAADVLRSIEEGKAGLPSKRRAPWRRTLVAGAVVVVVAATAGLLVARSAGQRTAGDQITGGAGAVADTATLLAQARALLGVDLKAAQDTYAQVLDEDPANAEALTYSGWLLYIASVQASAAVRQQAVDQAKVQMARAVAADATYPDPHCFLSIIALRVDADAATSQAEQQRCLDLDPPAQIRALMQSLTSPSDSTVPATTG